MTVTGTTFDRMRVTPMSDALIYNTAINPYRRIQSGNNTATTASGLNVTIDTGFIIVYGRLIEITEPETVSIPANFLGDVCVVIDLTKQNTSTGTPGQDDYMPVNNQVSIQVIPDGSMVKTDLFADGKIYMASICRVKSNTTNVEIRDCPETTIICKPQGTWKSTNNILDVIGDNVTMYGYWSNTKDIPANTVSPIYAFPEIDTNKLGPQGSVQPRRFSRTVVCDGNGGYTCFIRLNISTGMVELLRVEKGGTVVKLPANQAINLNGVSWSYWGITKVGSPAPSMQD